MTVTQVSKSSVKRVYLRGASGNHASTIEKWETEKENGRMREMGEQGKWGNLENKRTENRKTGERDNRRMGKTGEQENGEMGEGERGQEDGRTTGREQDEAKGQEANKEREALFLLPVPKAQ
ncbi:uncharacterized protein EDB93DRAFT_1103303 [Suillus bovinus]|uniref:uncharacterized protein n=1 Tax=Suillus bovinus TaxID=48563 RepID=UPI001B882EDA|nr:uncharacterized protein EDB93DRAFT_1103303 [Suillus bovinus]KAG2151094.1 hypothetical protein EDB93DRAFT_1103303 [Suillus bovinus]